MLNKTSKLSLLDALAGVANVLDVPGSMVRDTLLVKNPFDQLLHPLSDVNRTSSDELLKAYKLISNKKSIGNLAMSLGANFALDPLTWFGGSIVKSAPTLFKSLSKAF